MKNLFFILTLAFVSTFTNAQHKYTYSTGVGNPGAINTEVDSDLTGWTEVVYSGGDASTNVWSDAIVFPSDFSFLFMDGLRTKFQVSKNGCITFWGSGYLPTYSVPGDNTAPPPTAPRNLVAVFWDKFTTSAPLGDNDKIYYKIFGNKPNRQMWVKWYSYEMNTAAWVYFAAVLEESSSKIYMVDYKYNSGGSGLSCSVGIWDYLNGDMASGSPNITLASGTTANSDNAYYVFDPLPPANPSNPTESVDVDGCGPHTLTQTSTPFDPVVHYWQGTSCGTSKINSDATYSATANGTYYIRAYNSVTGKWSAGCGSVSVYDYLPRAPQPTFDVSTNTCGGKSLSMTSTTSSTIWVDGIEWQLRTGWQGTSCGTDESSLATDDDYYVTSSGTYYLRSWYEVFDIGIYPTCWSPCTSATVTINSVPTTPPVPDVTTNTCGDKTITRGTPPANVTYYWQTTAGGTSTTNSSLTYTAASSGNYYLRARSTAGCWSTLSSSVSVTVNSIPVEPAIPSVSPNTCGEKTISREDPPINTTYYWQSSASGMSTTNSVKSFATVTPGTYYLRASSSAGCWSNSSNVSVNIFEVPSAPTLPQISSNECGDKTITRDNPPFNVVYYWQDGLNGTKITDNAKNKIVTESSTYYLRAQTVDGGCWSDNTVSLLVNVRNPYNSERICLVTLDSATRKNRIIWERTPGKRTVSYNIYKIVSSNYSLIGNVKYSDLSVFIDEISDPEAEPYRYAIAVVDSCGLESAKSPTHQTMRLWSSISTEANSANINWYRYVDESGDFVPDSFYIYKGTSKEKMSLYHSQPATNKEIQIYTDNQFFGPVAYYQVAVKKKDLCSPAILKAEAGPYAQSLSNIVEYKTTANDVENNLPVSVYPNPFSENITIDISLDNSSDLLIEVINATGQITATFSYKNVGVGMHKINLQAKELNINEGICYLKIVVANKSSVVKCNHIK